MRQECFQCLRPSTAALKTCQATFISIHGQIIDPTRGLALEVSDFVCIKLNHPLNVSAMDHGFASCHVPSVLFACCHVMAFKPIVHHEQKTYSSVNNIFAGFIHMKRTRMSFCFSKVRVPNCITLYRKRFFPENFHFGSKRQEIHLPSSKDRREMEGIVHHDDVIVCFCEQMLCTLSYLVFCRSRATRALLLLRGKRSVSLLMIQDTPKRYSYSRAHPMEVSLECSMLLRNSSEVTKWRIHPVHHWRAQK